VYVTCNVMAGEYPANPTDPRHRSVTYALDAATGRIRWQRDMPAATFGALTLANGVLFQPTVPGTLYALDARRGDVLWSVEPGGDLGGGVSVANGHVVTGHGFWFLTQPARSAGWRRRVRAAVAARGALRRAQAWCDAAPTGPRRPSVPRRWVPTWRGRGHGFRIRIP
jgi:outer membrane protein assembly factor BamB